MKLKLSCFSTRTNSRIAAAASGNATIATYVAGSFAATSDNEAHQNRVSPNAADAQRLTPSPACVPRRSPIQLDFRRRSAPSAIRIPISRVQCVTMNDITINPGYHRLTTTRLRRTARSGYRTEPRLRRGDRSSRAPIVADVANTGVPRNECDHRAPRRRRERKRIARSANENHHARRRRLRRTACIRRRSEANRSCDIARLR